METFQRKNNFLRPPSDKKFIYFTKKFENQNYVEKMKIIHYPITQLNHFLSFWVQIYTNIFIFLFYIFILTKTTFGYHTF